MTEQEIHRDRLPRETKLMDRLFLGLTSKIESTKKSMRLNSLNHSLRMFTISLKAYKVQLLTIPLPKDIIENQSRSISINTFEIFKKSFARKINSFNDSEKQEAVLIFIKSSAIRMQAEKDSHPDIFDQIKIILMWVANNHINDPKIAQKIGFLINKNNWKELVEDLNDCINNRLEKKFT